MTTNPTTATWVRHKGKWMIEFPTGAFATGDLVTVIDGRSSSEQRVTGIRQKGQTTSIAQVKVRPGVQHGPAERRAESKVHSARTSCSGDCSSFMLECDSCGSYPHF